MLGFVLYWLGISILRMRRELPYAAWARQVFGNSLLFLILLSLTLSLDAILP
jgi:hypothetical protein